MHSLYVEMWFLPHEVLYESWVGRNVLITAGQLPLWCCGSNSTGPKPRHTPLKQCTFAGMTYILLHAPVLSCGCACRTNSAFAALQMTHDLKFDAETYGASHNIYHPRQWVMLGNASHQPVCMIDAAVAGCIQWALHSNQTCGFSSAGHGLQAQ